MVPMAMYEDKHRSPQRQKFNAFKKRSRTVMASPVENLAKTGYERFGMRSSFNSQKDLGYESKSNERLDQSVEL